MTDIIVKDTTGKTLNITEWEHQVKELIAKSADPRVVKPGSMTLSELEGHPMKEGLSRAYEREVTKYSGVMLFDKSRIQEGGDLRVYDVVFRPIMPEVTVLYKKAGFVNLIKDVFNISHDGVFGNPSETNLTSIGLRENFRNPIRGASAFRDVNDPKRTREVVQQIKIDRNKLVKTRDIFRNPRGILNHLEYEHSVAVYGGIPCQAITDYKLVLV